MMVGWSEASLGDVRNFKSEKTECTIVKSGREW